MIILLRSLKVIVCAALFASVLPSLSAQDQVTIPKSRLEELERKEKELERMKTSPKPAPAPPAASATAPAAVSTAPAAPQHVSPPMASLPALGQNEIVSALDLAAHYAADPNAADRRYREGKIRVRGEVERIEKRMMQRTYDLIIKTLDPKTEVVFELMAPDSIDSMYTTDRGRELKGTTGNSTFTMVKAGQEILIEGKCKGLKGRAVVVSGKQLGGGSQ